MKVFLDAGHNYSGADTGAEGNGLREQDITYYVTSKAAEKLRALGLEVRESRSALTANLGSGTVSSSLEERVRQANLWGADVFISVHCNSFSSSSAKGTEVYIYNNTSPAKALAEYVLSDVCALCGTVNRGVKERQNLYVLKNTSMPAILAELAFISNASDAEKLRFLQDEFATGIANGTAKYLGISVDAPKVILNKEESEAVLRTILEERTINFLNDYRFGDDLIVKLGNAIVN